MTSILKQENGELFIYRSEKEFPKLYTGEDSDLTESKSDHDLQIAFWFSSSERIKVAEGEKGKFNKFILFGKHNMFRDDVRHLDWDWIEIPESCYGVREKAGVYGMTKKGNQYFPGEKLAYFKDDRATEKETGEYEKTMQWAEKQLNRPHEHTSLDPKEQEELWKELIEDIIDFRDKNRETLVKVFSERFFLSRK